MPSFLPSIIGKSAGRSVGRSVVMRRMGLLRRDVHGVGVKGVIAPLSPFFNFLWSHSLPSIEKQKKTVSRYLFIPSFPSANLLFQAGSSLLEVGTNGGEECVSFTARTMSPRVDAFRDKSLDQIRPERELPNDGRHG